MGLGVYTFIQGCILLRIVPIWGEGIFQFIWEGFQVVGKEKRKKEEKGIKIDN